MTVAGPPPLLFPDPVRADLNAQQPDLAAEMERIMASHVRPCVAVTARRVSGAPLRRNPLARLFAGAPAAPVLGALESKFGGTPYCEEEEDWDDHVFLGQVDLAEATAVLPADGVKLTGLLRIDLGPPDRSFSDMFRVRWFPLPSAERAIAARPESVGSWEARLEFQLAWTLPEGKELEALWPLGSPPLYAYKEFYPRGYNADGFDEFHRMLGHMSSGLDEPYEFSPPPGWSQDLAGYECLLRVTYDNAAGFSWGTNWLYLLVPRENLLRGDLSRIIVTGANS